MHICPLSYAAVVRCRMLQLACVQADYSTERDSLKEIQHVLELPELKVIKLSDTRWFAHEQCVKAVKAHCTAWLLPLKATNRISMSQKLWDYIWLYFTSKPLQPSLYWIIPLHKWPSSAKH